MSKIDSIFFQRVALDPSFEFEIHPVRTQADALLKGHGQYDLHYHSFWEIDFVIGGEGVNIFENAIHHFEPGDIYIIPPYAMHNAYTTSEIELWCIQFNQETVIRSVFTDAEYNDEIGRRAAFANLVRTSHPQYGQLRDIIERTLREWQTREIGWRSATRLCLAELFIHLSRHFSVHDGSEGGGQEHANIRRALDYIHTNFTRPIRLSQVAERAIMNKNYFCTVFKKNIGCTYYAYLSSLRLHHACTLLRSTDQSVKEIAPNSGFSDISTFNKAFRRAFLTTPMEYRRAARTAGGAPSGDVLHSPFLPEDAQEPDGDA